MEEFRRIAVHLKYLRSCTTVYRNTSYEKKLHEVQTNYHGTERGNISLQEIYKLRTSRLTGERCSILQPLLRLAQPELIGRPTN